MGIAVGIDLGTTNSSIAYYNGKKVIVAKQVGGAMGSGAETTPSAIFIDATGVMHIGDRAYAQAARDPGNVAKGWKRLLGTGESIEFSDAKLSHTPEWCSTELLKRLFTFIPQQVRNDVESVVITVPAAFGQIKNEATLKAAEAAGLPNVKLMPEPVAACLAVMHEDSADKTFLVFDLGGGTFDVSIAEFKNGRGEILAQGGLENSGGRDWDLAITRKVIIPWIMDNYSISQNTLEDKHLLNLLASYAEIAKIELSMRLAMGETSATGPIRVPAGDIKFKDPFSQEVVALTDSAGVDITLDLELTQNHLDELIEEWVSEQVAACKLVASDCGRSLDVVDYIVFIGGPTLYPQLRAKVSKDLGIPEFATFVDPMTAVARGASIFASSLEAGAAKVKHVTEESSVEFPLELKYESRVTGDSAKLTMTLISLEHNAVQVEVRSNAYSSGLLPLNFSKELSLPLPDDGVNTFTVAVTVPGSSQIVTRQLEIHKTIEITGVPLSHSLFVEVLSSDGSSTEPLYLAQVGERLPVSGEFKVSSQVELNSKSGNTISFRIWQGQISDRVSDNTYIGELKLPADHLGRLDKIAVEDELICAFAIGEGLDLNLSISVPSIGQKFDGLYMPGDAIRNPTKDWKEFASEARRLKRDLEFYVQRNPSQELESLLPKIQDAIDVIETSVIAEEVQSASEKIKTFRRTFFDARQGDMPQRLLQRYQATVDFFRSSYDGKVEQNATNAERKTFGQHAALAEAAARAGDEKIWDSEDDQMWEVIRSVIWRSDWWVRDKLETELTEGGAGAKKAAKNAIAALDKGDFNAARLGLAGILQEKRTPKNAGPQLDIKKI